MKLKEIKTNDAHYFRDDDFNLQGEYKEYFSDGQLWVHCYFKDGKRHGEYKVYNPDGQLWVHCYFKDGKDITNMYLKLQTWKSL